MTLASTASIVSGAWAPEAVPAAQTTHPRIDRASVLLRSTTVATALDRARRPDYFNWLHHVQAAAGCTRPIRLSGRVLTVEPATGQILASMSTADMPDQVIYKPCGNRRASVCPSCSTTYQADAYQLLHAGLVGGKGIPDTVAQHPAIFATFTAPSFGPVHARVVHKHTCGNRKHCQCRPEPCHPRRQTSPDGFCCHGQPTACFVRHDSNDPRLGEPLCMDCYDYDTHAVWNLFAGELWRRTKQAIDRHLAQLAHQRGLSQRVTLPCGKWRSISPVRIAHGKAAEFQTRGAIHFHALLRLDGISTTNPDAIVAPPAGITIDDLDRGNQPRHQTHHLPHPEPPDRRPTLDCHMGYPDRYPGHRSAQS